MSDSDIWAVVPVKDTAAAKQRLDAALPQHLRRELALAMLADCLVSPSGVRGLAARILVTTEPGATALAARYGLECWTEGAADGHTGAVAAAARRLAREAKGGMLTLPGDIPLV